MALFMPSAHRSMTVNLGTTANCDPRHKTTNISFALLRTHHVRSRRAVPLRLREGARCTILTAYKHKSR